MTMRMLPDDPSAPLATRLLLALWIQPEHAAQVGDDAVVEAAAHLRADAHRFPMATEDYGSLATENKELRWVAERALRYISEHKPSEDLEHDLRRALGQDD